MGAWGYGPFDNDTAGDMAAGLAQKVRHVVEGRRDYGYSEARAAAQFLIVSHGTDILGGPGLQNVVKLLVMMRKDVDFLASCREPKQMAAVLEKELADVLAKMRSCRGCKKSIDRAERKELDALVASIRFVPVPKSTIPSRRSRLRMLKKISSGKGRKRSHVRRVRKLKPNR